MKIYDYIISIDSTVFMAHKEMYLYELIKNNNAKAEIHKNWLQKIVPWYFPRIEANALKAMKKIQNQRR